MGKSHASQYANFGSLRYFLEKMYSFFLGIFIKYSKNGRLLDKTV